MATLSDIVTEENAPYWADVCYANALEKLSRVKEASSFFCSALTKKYSEHLAFRILRLLPFLNEKNECIESIDSSVDEFLTRDKQGTTFESFADYSRIRGDYGTAAKMYSKAIRAGNDTDSVYRRSIFTSIREGEYTKARKSLACWESGTGGKEKVRRLAKLLSQKILSQPHYVDLQDILLCEYYKYEQKLYDYSKAELLEHYITIGLDEELNPNPWFNSEYFIEQYSDKIKKGEPSMMAYLRLERKESVRPSDSFDPEYYLATNPDLHGVGSLFAHYSRHGHFEGRAGVPRSVPDALLSEIDEISEIEPKVVGAVPDLHKIVRYPRVYRSLFLPDMVAQRYQGIKAIVCVPFLSRGGADLVSTYALQALQEDVGADKVLLVVTDQNMIDTAEWYDKDTNVVVLGNECTFENEEDKLETLLSIIGKLGPEKVLNVNSKLCWELFREYGKQISSVLQLYAYLFCYDYDNKDRRVGYITEYLSETIKYLDGVFFDNKQIVSSIKKQYGFSQRNEQRLRYIYTPNLSTKSGTFNNPKSKDKILWIGRLARQKRPDVLIEIAEAMPSIEFHVYGDRGNAPSSDLIVSNSIKNIHFHGTYSDLEKIEVEKYSMFLLTSQWEGIPTILITMMGLGVPVVSPLVGGVGELVEEDTGWPVANFDQSEEYCRVIRQVLLDEEDRLTRQKNAKRVVGERHSWEQFVAGLKNLGLLENQNELEKVS